MDMKWTFDETYSDVQKVHWIARVEMKSKTGQSWKKLSQDCLFAFALPVSPHCREVVAENSVVLETVSLFLQESLTRLCLALWVCARL